MWKVYIYCLSWWSTIPEKGILYSQFSSRVTFELNLKKIIKNIYGVTGFFFYSSGMDATGICRPWTGESTMSSKAADPKGSRWFFEFGESSSCYGQTDCERGIDLSNAVSSTSVQALPRRKRKWGWAYGVGGQPSRAKLHLLCNDGNYFRRADVLGYQEWCPRYRYASVSWSGRLANLGIDSLYSHLPIGVWRWFSSSAFLLRRGTAINNFTLLKSCW